MKILSSFAGAVVLILVVAFALSNQTSVTLSLWPLDGGLAVPLYGVALLPFVAGLIMGSAAGWAGLLRLRRRLRRVRQEYAALQKAAQAPSAPQLLSWWKKIGGIQK